MLVKRKKKHVVFRKTIAFLLVFLLVIGILPFGMISTAHAAEAEAPPEDIPLLRDLPKASGSPTPTEPEEPEDVVDTEGLTPPVTEGKGLESDETQAAQAAKLGLPTDQPSRISPSGKEIDKEENPLGSDLVVRNRIYQMAYSDTDDELVYSKPYNGGTQVNLNDTVVKNDPAKNDDFNSNRVVAAADVNGDGKQELVTAGFVSPAPNRTDLKLFVADYNDLIEVETKVFNSTIKIKKPKSSDMYIVAEKVGGMGGTGYGNTSFKMTAVDFDGDGKDEIAIAGGKQLWICRADMSSFQVLSSKVYNGEIMDIEGKDADGDGFVELLVAKREEGSATSRWPELLIFDSADDLSSPAHTISLSCESSVVGASDGNPNNNIGMYDVSVDVGDIFGDGIKRIVIAATNGPGKMLSSVSFDPKTESFSAIGKIYSLTDADSVYAFYKVQTKVDIKCVSLTTPVPGDPVSLVMGGVIYKYNVTNQTFERKPVTVWTEDSSGDVKPNSETTCRGNITNVNATNDHDKTWIIDTIVGNFDGNENGKEQIIMLHYNKWYSKEIVHITQCYATDPTEDKPESVIKADMKELWRSGDSSKPYKYPKICPIDVKNTGITLKFHPEKSKFMFSNPIVSAVLAVSPYYSELADVCEGLDEAATVYGTGTERTDSESNGVSANVGVTFGFEQGFSVLGVQILQVEFEAHVNNSFSYEWTSGKSIEKTSSFSNRYSDNAVVVTVIPQDIYYYTATSSDADGNVKTEEMVMQIPYAPITTIKPVSRYNQIAAQIPNAPVITPEVLGDITVGDPRTYPSTAVGLSNVTNEDVIMVGSDENSSLDACGTGDSAGEQTLTSTSFSEKRYQYELSYNASYNVAVFGVSTGIEYGAGYTRASAVTDSEFTTRGGTVASVPADYDQYEFQWALAAYKYDLPAGDTVQRCEVINYLVKPIGSFPPKMPSNLQLDSRSLDSNVLKWEAAEGAAGYTVSRFTTETGTVPEKTYTVTGRNTLSCTDNSEDFDRDKTYYYRILAYSTKNSREVGPLKVDALAITGISVATQPKLTYNEDEALDLSALVVTLTASNGGSYSVGFSDFADADVTTSVADGVAMTPSQSGTHVTVKYKQDISANTRNFTVNAKSPYDFTISVNFKVGTQSNATALQPNQTLQAVTELTNTTSSTQNVLVILALYSDKGNMEKSSFVTQSIAAGQKQTVTPSITLPGNVTGYTAKVFVWDGTSYATTTLSPKTQVVKIPV